MLFKLQWKEIFFKYYNVSDVNEYNNDTAGYTFLGIACFNGHLEIVKLLLFTCNGVDVNKGRIKNESPLELACARGHSEIVQLLLQLSSVRGDVNLKIKNGKTISEIKKELTEKEKMQKLQEKERIEKEQERNQQEKIEKEKLIMEQKRREQEGIEKEKIEKERSQPFISTHKVFSDMCSLNQMVIQQREQIHSQFNQIALLSTELPINSQLEQEYLNIVKVLHSCNFMINETLTSNASNIEKDEHVSHINTIMENIRKSVEIINSEQYLIKLNYYIEQLDEKVQLFEEFIEQYVNQDYLKDDIAVIHTQQSIKTMQETLKNLNKSSGNSINNNLEKQSIDCLQVINAQFQNITNSFNTGNQVDLNNFSNNLMKAVEVLEKEQSELEKQTRNTKILIPSEVQIGINQLYANYQNQNTQCIKFMQDIPFIIEKHEQLQRIVDIMNNYKELSGQFTALQRKKPRLTRELNGVKLDIDGLKDELQHITNKNELKDMEDEIKEKEETLKEKKKSLKECIDQANEIKLKFIQLKTIGFDMQSILKTSIASSLNIEEMSSDLFKEIKPIQDFVGNHHLFIGTDINDKKHVN